MKSESWLPTLWGESKELRDPFAAMRRQMEEMFEDLPGLGRFSKPTANGMLTPRVDISETDKELRLTAELPGVEQKDISVTLTGDVLTIKGEKRTESETKSGDKEPMYHRVERSYGSFQRSMSVPYDVDPSKVDAKFKDGVLTVTLPKPAEVQRQAKQIEIKKAA
jgi:HSP20 family protein